MNIATYTVYKIEIDGRFSNKEHLNNADEVNEWMGRKYTTFAKIAIVSDRTGSTQIWTDNGSWYTLAQTIHRTTIEPLTDRNGNEVGGMKISAGAVAIADLLTALMRKIGEIKSSHRVSLEDFKIEHAFFGGCDMQDLCYVVTYRGVGYDIEINGKSGTICTAY